MSRSDVGKYTISVPISEDSMFLFYLAGVCRLEFEQLLFLYEKYGKDVYYFFYMLGGSRIAMPDNTKLARMREKSKLVYKKLLGEDIPLVTKQQRKAFEAVKNVYSEERKQIVISKKGESVGKV